ncbi:pirin family protein [Thiomicrorhabdus sp.]|uniref:pirin family protein n=1 Tax=Thiomicrorhabdus sp. TaxID=2039724 RepID=UPI0029C8CBA5|nr:pirin family protein [Thiomicrorhabdus sp.]
MTTQTRQIQQISRGIAASDGAGVRLTRLLGHPQFKTLDPFLMMDHFASDNPDDYIAGFPPHPHRGFETVTYLLAGTMKHQDNVGHEGVLKAGGIQWMTAGRGIIHSEMPQQENGLLSGFQLWINLPAEYKMIPAAYQEYEPEQIPLEKRPAAELKLICGETSLGNRGAVINRYVNAQFWDVRLDAQQSFVEPVSESAALMIYLVEGELSIGNTTLYPGDLASLDSGEQVQATATGGASRFLWISGEPIGEPVAQAGPFVMNTQQELRQAFSDFKAGRF